MNIFNAIITAIAPAIIPAIITIVLTPIVNGFFSKKSLQLKVDRKKIKVYSPLIQFFDNPELSKTPVNKIISTLDLRITKYYDYIIYDIIRKLKILKLKSEKNTLDDDFLNALFEIYYLCQMEYNTAKKSNGLDYNYRYSDMHLKNYSTMNYIFLVISGVAYTVIYISNYFTNTYTIDELKSLAIGFLALVFLLICGSVIVFLIVDKTTRYKAQKAWKRMLINYKTPPKAGAKNANLQKNNRRKQHKA